MSEFADSRTYMYMSIRLKNLHKIAIVPLTGGGGQGHSGMSSKECKFFLGLGVVNVNNIS